MRVDEIMTTHPVTVTERTGIGEALAMLGEQGIRHLPVVRGGTVVGMLSDRDFGSLGVALVNDAEGYDRLRTRLSQPVSVLMSGGVVTVSAEDDISEVVDLMLEEKLGALPVVAGDDQQLVGIVSYIDVLRAVEPLLESE